MSPKQPKKKSTDKFQMVPSGPATKSKGKLLVNLNDFFKSGKITGLNADSITIDDSREKK